MNQDFAYLLGAFGDGCLYQCKARGEYCIEFEQKVADWLANSILPRFQKVYGKVSKVRKREAKGELYRVRIYSKQAFFEIQNAMQDLSFLLNEDLQVKAHFIRGFFDAEGSVPKRKPGTSYRIEIYQKDTLKLALIAQMLESFGIVSKKITNSRDIGQLNIRGVQNIARFRECIGAEHPEKLKALNQLF